MIIRFIFAWEEADIGGRQARIIRVVCVTYDTVRTYEKMRKGAQCGYILT
jgi:hypothetical protein